MLIAITLCVPEPHILGHTQHAAVYVRLSWGCDFWKLHVRRSSLICGCSSSQQMLEISDKKTSKCEIFPHMYFDKMGNEWHL